VRSQILGVNMIIRAPRPESHFVQIRNDVVRDRRLSYKARGLLAYILSFPDNYRITSDALSDASDVDGRTAVLSGLAELREAGYLVTETVRDAKGTFAKRSHVFDEPQLTQETMNDDFPKEGFPKSETPTINTEHSEQNTRSRSLHQTGKSSTLSEGRGDTSSVAPTVTPGLPVAYARGGYSPDYESFWEVFPRKVGKKAAHRAWLNAALDVDPSVIIAGALRYSTDPNREPAFTVHPATWLNQGRWDDDPLPVRASRRSTGGERRMDSYSDLAAKIGQVTRGITA
jgi:hypothetical protein